MSNYFTAQEVLERVEGVHSLSTLNKWANFIQKECGYPFHYESIPFASHTKTRRTINHRKTRLFSDEDIQKLQKVAELIPTIGREGALRQVFDKRHHFNQMNHSELMDKLMEQVALKEQKNEVKFLGLMKKYQQLGRQVQMLNNQLEQLKERLSAYE
jgi:ribosomal protein L17